MSDTEKRPVKPDLKWSSDLSAPFIWLEWIMEWIVYGFSKLVFFKILEYAAKLTILLALILYVLEVPERKRQAELNAWQIVNSAIEQKAASGRVEALEYLNNAGVDLNFLSVPNAYLIGTTKEGETRGINLPDAKLRGANFAKSTLTDANFNNAQLRKANLEGANLMGANLRGAALWRANLEGANLMGAYLGGAHLWEADLRGADLRGANLMGAFLQRADLRKANLEGANLERADLRNAKNITSDQLCKARTLYEVKLDSGLREIVKIECPELLVEPQ